MSNPTEAAPRLTETQRALAVDRLSGDERRFLVVALAATYPATFDALMADMNSRPGAAELKASTR